MRLVSVLTVAALVTLPAQPIAAQISSGRPAPKAPAQASASTFTVPKGSVVNEHANPATLLVEKRKKLDLDDATVASLKTLAATIDERNAPLISTYDSLRTRMRTGDAVAGAAGDEARARNRAMGETVRAIKSPREEDKAAALALVPADKQEEAKKLLAQQDQDLTKATESRRGGGPPGGKPPRPTTR
jgi:hypothetical protein